MIKDLRIWAFNDAMRDFLGLPRLITPEEIKKSTVHENGISHYKENMKHYGIERDWENIDPTNKNSYHQKELQSLKANLLASKTMAAPLLKAQIFDISLIKNKSEKITQCEKELAEHIDEVTRSVLYRNTRDLVSEVAYMQKNQSQPKSA